MARLAIFIDGGYLDKLAETAAVRIDYRLFPQEVTKAVGDRTPEPLDLLRTYYYHCLPYQSASPTPERSRKGILGGAVFSRCSGSSLGLKSEREDSLMRVRMPRADPYSVRNGQTSCLDWTFALLSSKRNITHAAVVSGDSDLLPAFDVARQEGISVWLFHGP